MTVVEFRRQAKALGFDTRKQKKLEVLDVLSDGTEHCTITYAEFYSASSAYEILTKKLRPEYIPPLG